MSGKHVIANLYGCRKDLLNDGEFIQRLMLTAAKEANGTIVSYYTHLFSPYGITSYVLISESHLSIHTYPEFCSAFVDIFTCGSNCYPIKALKYIRDKLLPKTIKLKRIYRVANFEG